MSTLNLGKIRFNWTGAYNNSTAYVANDVVSSSGNSYICKLASTGNAVSNGTYWDLMSSAGADGTNGTNGTNGTDLGTVLTTQGDIVYRDGSGLQRLAKGTASQQLAMNSGATAPEWITASSGGGYWTEVASGEVSGNTNINITSLPANKILKLFLSGIMINPTILLSNDNGSSYRSTNQYAICGGDWRSDETTFRHFRDQTADGLLDQGGWFAQGSYGCALEATFYNLSQSTKGSCVFITTTGSHNRSGKAEATIGWLSGCNLTIETNNALRIVTSNSSFNCRYMLLSGDDN